MTKIRPEWVEKAAKGLRQHAHVGTEVDMEAYAEAVLAAAADDIRREVAEEIAEEIMRAAGPAKWTTHYHFADADARIAREVGER